MCQIMLENLQREKQDTYWVVIGSGNPGVVSGLPLPLGLRTAERPMFLLVSSSSLVNGGHFTVGNRAGGLLPSVILDLGGTLALLFL